MIVDYDKYHLSGREKLKYILISYPLALIVLELFYDSWMITVLLAIGVIFFQGMYASYLCKKRKEELLTEFKDFLYSVVASISIGKSMRMAIKDSFYSLDMIYPQNSLIMIEVKAMISNMENNNFSEKEVLLDFAERSNIEEILNFAQIYASCIESGGDVKNVLNNTINILSDKMNLQREIKTIVAQRQMEGRIVATMPILILLGLNLFSKDYLMPMYTSIVGRVIMTICLIGYIGSAKWIVNLLDWE